MHGRRVIAASTHERSSPPDCPDAESCIGRTPRRRRRRSPRGRRRSGRSVWSAQVIRHASASRALRCQTRDRHAGRGGPDRTVSHSAKSSTSTSVSPNAGGINGSSRTTSVFPPTSPLRRRTRTTVSTSSQIGRDTRIRIGDPNITFTGQRRYELEYTLPDARLESGFLALDIIGNDETFQTDRFTVEVVGFELSDPTCDVGRRGEFGGCELEPSVTIATSSSSSRSSRARGSRSAERSRPSRSTPSRLRSVPLPERNPTGLQPLGLVQLAAGCRDRRRRVLRIPRTWQQRGVRWGRCGRRGLRTWSWASSRCRRRVTRWPTSRPIACPTAGSPSSRPSNSRRRAGSSRGRATSCSARRSTTNRSRPGSPRWSHGKRSRSPDPASRWCFVPVRPPLGSAPWTVVTWSGCSHRRRPFSSARTTRRSPEVWKGIAAEEKRQINDSGWWSRPLGLAGSVSAAAVVLAVVGGFVAVRSVRRRAVGAGRELVGRSRRRARGDGARHRGSGRR